MKCHNIKWLKFLTSILKDLFFNENNVDGFSCRGTLQKKKKKRVSFDISLNLYPFQASLNRD